MNVLLSDDFEPEARVHTLSHHLRQRSTAGRIGAYFAICGAGGALSLATGMGRAVASFMVAVGLVVVDAAIWLRNNPTLKQMERRRPKDERVGDDLGS